MAKPSGPQSTFISAILKRGGTDVPGPKLFASRGGITVDTNTLNSCQRRGWVKRDERDGVAFWTVTTDGQTAVGAA